MLVGEDGPPVGEGVVTMSESPAAQVDLVHGRMIDGDVIRPSPDRLPTMDVMRPEDRVKAMRNNRGRTRPERALARELWLLGLRYVTPKGYASRYRQRLAGSPDIIFPRQRIVVFVDGCFWHGCQECGRVPASQYWVDKIARNRRRDDDVTAELGRRGWRVIRIAEHRLRTKPRRAATVAWLSDAVQTSSAGARIPAGRVT